MVGVSIYAVRLWKVHLSILWLLKLATTFFVFFACFSFFALPRDCCWCVSCLRYQLMQHTTLANAPQICDAPVAAVSVSSSVVANDTPTLAEHDRNTAHTSGQDKAAAPSRNTADKHQSKKSKQHSSKKSSGGGGLTKRSSVSASNIHHHHHHHSSSSSSSSSPSQRLRVGLPDGGWSGAQRPVVVNVSRELEAQQRRQREARRLMRKPADSVPAVADDAASRDTPDVPPAPAAAAAAVLGSGKRRRKGTDVMGGLLGRIQQLYTNNATPAHAELRGYDLDDPFINDDDVVCILQSRHYWCTS
jgi:hypothetical protein